MIDDILQVLYIAALIIAVVWIVYLIKVIRRDK